MPSRTNANLCPAIKLQQELAFYKIDSFHLPAPPHSGHSSSPLTKRDQVLEEKRRGSQKQTPVVYANPPSTESSSTTFETAQNADVNRASAAKSLLSPETAWLDVIGSDVDGADSPAVTPGQNTSLKGSAQRASTLLLHYSREHSSAQAMTMHDIENEVHDGQEEGQLLLDIEDEHKQQNAEKQQSREQLSTSTRSELYDDTLLVSAYEAPVRERETLSEELKRHLEEVGLSDGIDKIVACVVILSRDSKPTCSTTFAFQYRLLRLGQTLVERGYCLPEDIACADAAELESVAVASSLKKPERRRWEKMAAALRRSLSQKQEAMTDGSSAAQSSAVTEALKTTKSPLEGDEIERSHSDGRNVGPLFVRTLLDEGDDQPSSFSPVAALAESAQGLQVDLNIMGSHVMRLESKIVQQKRLKAKLESARIEAEAKLGNARRELTITQHNVSELESDERDVRKILGEEELRENKLHYRKDAQDRRKSKAGADSDAKTVRKH